MTILGKLGVKAAVASLALAGSVFISSCTAEHDAQQQIEPQVPPTASSAQSALHAQSGQPVVVGKTAAGFELANGTPYDFVLTSVTGDNTSVPAVGSVLEPWEANDQRFNVVFRVAKTTTVTAVYSINEGEWTGTITFSVDAVGVTDIGGSLTDGDWSVKSGDNGNAWVISYRSHG